MKPQLEPLEDRCSPSSSLLLAQQAGTWDVRRVDLSADAHLSYPPLLNLYLSECLLLDQVGIVLNPSVQNFGPRTLVEIQVGKEQFQHEYGFQGLIRSVVPILGSGLTPVILCPTFIAVDNHPAALAWEEASLAMGWWSGDDPGPYPGGGLTPGPSFGRTPLAPDMLRGDLDFLSGDPFWWASAGGNPVLDSLLGSMLAASLLDRATGV